MPHSISEIPMGLRFLKWKRPHFKTSQFCGTACGFLHILLRKGQIPGSPQSGKYPRKATFGLLAILAYPKLSLMKHFLAVKPLAFKWGIYHSRTAQPVNILRTTSTSIYEIITTSVITIPFHIVFPGVCCTPRNPPKDLAAAGIPVQETGKLMYNI